MPIDRRDATIEALKVVRTERLHQLDGLPAVAIGLNSSTNFVGD